MQTCLHYPPHWVLYDSLTFFTRSISDTEIHDQKLIQTGLQVAIVVIFHSVLSISCLTYLVEVYHMSAYPPLDTNMFCH